MMRPRRSLMRGMTLLEVMVSIGILAMISVLIYGAFDGMSRSKKGLSNMNQRYREGRLAMRRISRELSSAFISVHQPLSPHLSVRTTMMKGANSSPADRIDFASFSHTRVLHNAHESDQNEISYFGSTDPEVSNKTDLARREATIIDLEPEKGGVVQVLAEDIDLFDLKYLDPITGMWQEHWDTSQATDQLGRLPVQIKVSLVLRNGPGGKNIPLVMRVPISMQAPLSFAVPQ